MSWTPPNHNHWISNSGRYVPSKIILIQEICIPLKCQLTYNILVVKKSYSICDIGPHAKFQRPRTTLFLLQCPKAAHTFHLDQLSIRTEVKILIIKVEPYQNTNALCFGNKYPTIFQAACISWKLYQLTEISWRWFFLPPDGRLGRKQSDNDYLCTQDNYRLKIAALRHTKIKILLCPFTCIMLYFWQHLT